MTKLRTARIRRPQLTQTAQVFSNEFEDCIQVKLEKRVSKYFRMVTLRAHKKFKRR